MTLGTIAAAAALALWPHPATSPQGSYTLVQLRPSAACTEAITLLQAGATPLAPELRLFRLPAEAARRLAPGLRAHDALETLEPDRTVANAAVRDTQPDPLEAGEWWRTVIGLEGLTPPGPGKPVTIVDSGIDLQHPEFANRPDTLALNTQEPAPLGGEHGTSVASLIGAPENGVGIVGVYPQAVLRSWDAALGSGTGLQTSDIIGGILTAAADGPGVINLSLGGTDPDPLVEQAVETAFARGSLVVAAAGNDGLNGNPREYPASLPHVLAVAATSRDDQAASFSSKSPYVDLAAPGQDITVASAVGNDWHDSSGTSFSAPIVSGVAAWVWTARPDLDNTQLLEVLRRSARDIGAPGRDDATGFGMLDVRSALAYPAPARDPLEPNEDISYVQPGAYFDNHLPPLTSPGAPIASLAARVDRFKDPYDVYRIWLPARRRVAVTVRSRASLQLALFGPGAATVKGSAGLLGVGIVETGAGARIVAASTARGRWAYVDVSLRGKAGLYAGYALTVAPA